ncbi:hypothetical protein SGPA1_50152 [Streptomyces misionensis JCM 4497]
MRHREEGYSKKSTSGRSFTVFFEEVRGFDLIQSILKRSVT